MNSIASKSPIVSWMVLNVISSGEIETPKAKHRLDDQMVPSFSPHIHTKARGMQESTFRIAPLKPVIELKQEPISLGGYGRLSPLINDASVSAIEYSGENSPLKVTRFGRIQPTNILLSPLEVESILKFVSEKTNIPLQNQVFKVAVDNFLFNAIVSKEMGTRFFIKKNFRISPDYTEAFR